MARIRSIKPDFFRHGGLFDAEKESGFPLRVAFAGLWTSADRDGRFQWRPRELKLDCLPHDEVDFSRVLDALGTRGFIRKYRVDGVDYGFIPSWHEHQVINNRESASTLPEPIESSIESATWTREARDVDASFTREARDDHAGTGEGKGREGKYSEAKASAAAPQQPIPAKPLTAKEKLWATGIALMGEKSRAHIGRLVATYGEDVVAEAMGAAIDAEPGDPKAWIVKACESAAKRKPSREKTPEADLLDDPRPRWALDAGFANRFEANNDRCYEHNASQFRGGKRVEQAA